MNEMKGEQVATGAMGLLERAIVELDPGDDCGSEDRRGAFHELLKKLDPITSSICSDPEFRGFLVEYLLVRSGLRRFYARCRQALCDNPQTDPDRLICNYWKRLVTWRHRDFLRSRKRDPVHKSYELKDDCGDDDDSNDNRKAMVVAIADCRSDIHARQVVALVLDGVEQCLTERQQAIWCLEKAHSDPTVFEGCASRWQQLLNKAVEYVMRESPRGVTRETIGEAFAAANDALNTRFRCQLAEWLGVRPSAIDKHVSRANELIARHLRDR